MVDRRRSFPTRAREMGRPIMPSSFEAPKELPVASKPKNVMDILNAEKPSRENSFLNTKSRANDFLDKSGNARESQPVSRKQGRHYRINSVEDIFDPEKRSLQRSTSSESRDSGLYSVEASSMASDRPPTRNSSRPST